MGPGYRLRVGDLRIGYRLRVGDRLGPGYRLRMAICFRWGLKIGGLADYMGWPGGTMGDRGGGRSSEDGRSGRWVTIWGMVTV